MRKYGPKYRRQGKGRLRRISGFFTLVATRLKRAAPAGNNRPQAVVVAQQKKWQISVLSRKGGLLVLCCVVLAAGGLYFRQVLTNSDIFRLSTLSVQGNRMVRKTEILDLGGIEQGINLLSFDTKQAEKAVSEHEWIESVEIVRAWPSSLTIKVHEYRPLAMINIESKTGRGLYYVDRKGKVFAKVDANHELDYPVITGVDSMDKVTGTVIAETGLAARAFEFIRLAAQGNPIVPLQTISEVNVSPGKGIVVYLVDRPFPIYMGSEGMRTKYNKLVRLLESLYRRKKIEEIKEIRMDYFGNRVLVAKVES